MGQQAVFGAQGQRTAAHGQAMQGLPVLWAMCQAGGSLTLTTEQGTEDLAAPGGCGWSTGD